MHWLVKRKSFTARTHVSYLKKSINLVNVLSSVFYLNDIWNPFAYLFLSAFRLKNDFLNTCSKSLIFVYSLVSFLYLIIMSVSFFSHKIFPSYQCNLFCFIHALVVFSNNSIIKLIAF